MKLSELFLYYLRGVERFLTNCLIQIIHGHQKYIYWVLQYPNLEQKLLIISCNLLRPVKIKRQVTVTVLHVSPIHR